MKENAEAKQAILAAAIEEFAECGIGNARTSSIASRAGVTSGLLHYHFGTKANLYSEVINIFYDMSIIENIVIVPIQRKCNPLEKLQLILYVMTQWMLNPWSYNVARLFFRIMAGGTATVNNLITNYHFVSERYIASIIKEGIQEGYFCVNNPYHFVFDIMISVSNQLAMHYLLKGEAEKEEFFPGNFEESLRDYVNATSIRRIISPAYINKIKPLSKEITSVVDQYILAINIKEKFSSWNLAIGLVAKLFNDKIK